MLRYNQLVQVSRWSLIRYVNFIELLGILRLWGTKKIIMLGINLRSLHKNGQGIVEFVIILPILVLLVIGVLDFGRAFHTYQRVSNAAREGAFFLASHPADQGTCSDPHTSALDDPSCYPNTKAAIGVEIDTTGWDSGVAEITITDCCTKGAAVAVTVAQQITLTGVSLFVGPTEIENTVRMLVQNAP